MRRAALVVAAVSLTGCLDFQGLLDDCRDGGGPCARGADAGTDAGDAKGDAGQDAGPAGDGGVSLCPVAPPFAATLPLGEVRPAADGGTAFCFNGFQWENPLPQGNALSAVRGHSLDDVWAAGTASTLMHWDGQRWQTHQGVVPVSDVRDSNIAGLRLLPDGTGWLVGSGVAPHRFEDGGWWPITSPVPLGEWFYSALSASPDGRHLAAVSPDGRVGRPPDWAPTGTPPPTGEARAVALTDDGGCVYSASLYDTGVDATLRWLRTCDGQLFLDLDAGSGAGAVWAKPGGAFGFTWDDAVYEWADGGVQRVAGNPGDATFYLGASLLADGSEGYLVGTNKRVSNIFTGAPQAVAGAPGPERRFLDVQAFADGGAWAVGVGGALARRDAQGWRWAQGGFMQALYGLFVDERGYVAVGQDDLVLTQAGALRLAVGGGLSTDVARLADGGLLTVSREGQVRHGLAVVGNPGVHLHGLFADSSGDGWAVGDEGVILRGSDGGLRWVEDAPRSPSRSLWKVHEAGGFVVAVGSGEAVATRTDAGWSTRASGSGDAFGVFVDDGAAQQAWVVGSGPTIQRYSGGSLADATPPALSGLGGGLFDVWGFGKDDVWAVGSNGLAVHWDGAQWQRVETGTRNDLERVRGRVLPGGVRELFMAGSGGTLLRYRY